MKYIKKVPVYVLALVFVVFGLMFFLKLPMPPMSGVAGDFAGILFTTGYLTIVKVCEVVIGVLLFIPRTQKLGLILIAPIIVNIFLFEVLLQKSMGMGALLLAVECIALYQYRASYKFLIVK